MRSPQRPQLSGLGAILQGGGFARSQDDTYSVHDYVLSRDALAELDEKLDLRQVFRRNRSIRFNRFTALEWDLSFESFYKYYRKRVAVEYDTVSAITVLTVACLYRRRTPQRQRLAAAHERAARQPAQRPQPQRPHQRRREGGQGFRGSTPRMRRSRSPASAAAKSVFDPDRQAAMQLQGTAKIQEELAGDGDAACAAASGLAAATRRSRASSAARSCCARRSRRQEARVTGKQPGVVHDPVVGVRPAAAGEDRSPSVSSPRSLAALENARNEAQRQQLYLETLVQPNLPDKRDRAAARCGRVAMVFLLGLIVWGVLSLVACRASREHTE